MDEQSHTTAAGGYERSTIDLQRIALSFAALVGILIVVAIATWWLIRAAPTDRQLPLVAPGPAEIHLPPSPRLQATPSRDIAAYRRDQAARLQGYRWIDRERGIVQIPIERAMTLQAKRAQSARGAPP